MRVYFEKPRTVTGWKGLINDPGIDGTHDVTEASGWRASCCSTWCGLACRWAASELDPITPQYLAER